ncbi:MAG: hypothetical protein ACOYYJ_18840 [Chloroflexota bacterium]
MERLPGEAVLAVSLPGGLRRRIIRLEPRTAAAVPALFAVHALRRSLMGLFALGAMDD